MSEPPKAVGASSHILLVEQINVRSLPSLISQKHERKIGEFKTSATECGGTLTSQTVPGQSTLTSAMVVEFPDQNEVPKEFLDSLNWHENAGIRDGYRISVQHVRVATQFVP